MQSNKDLGGLIAEVIDNTVAKTPETCPGQGICPDHVDCCHRLARLQK